MAFEIYTKKGKINNKEQSQLKQMTIGYYKPSRKKLARKTILILPQYNEESSNRALFGDIVGTKMNMTFVRLLIYKCLQICKMWISAYKKHLSKILIPK